MTRLTDHQIVGLASVAAMAIVVAGRLAQPQVVDVLLPNHGDLAPRVWWALVAGACFGIPTVAYARFTGFTLSELGLGLGALRRDAGIYAVAYAVCLPAVLLASRGAEARALYPLCAGARDGFGSLAAWLLVYACMYIGLEAMFRGALLFPLVDRLGSAAGAFGVAPYVWVHVVWGKGLAEALAAIPWALVMARLALRTRSIWGTAALHFAVAATLDVAILAQDGTFARWMAP